MQVLFKTGCLLLVVLHVILAGLPYRSAVRRVRREQAGISRTSRTSLTRELLPTAYLAVFGRPGVAAEMRAWRKLSLTSAGFETLDHLEYIESGVRVSKGCYVALRRPVVVLHISPRIHSLADSYFSSETWSHVARSAKAGPIVILRLGESPPYAHALVPLVGAWHVHGWVPGRALLDPFSTRDEQLSGYSRHYNVTTILDERSINREQSAYYQARGTRACSRLP